MGNITSLIRPTSAPKNPGGITPTIVNGIRCTVSWRPTMSSAPAKRCRQRRWLITTTGPSDVSRRSSAGVSIRPRMAVTPSTSKKRPLTYAASTRSAWPLVERSNLWLDHANAPSKNSVSRVLISSQIGCDHDPLRSSARAAGIAHRQRPQDQAVEDREQRRVGADAERERQHDDGREAGISSNLPDAVPEILCELVDQEVPPHPGLLALVLIAAVAPRVRQITELPQRLTTRRVSGHPLRHESSMRISR